MALYWGMIQQITGGFSPTTAVTYTTSTTFTVPAGITQIQVECWGGGGAGGGGSNPSNAGGAGGGAGGSYAIKLLTVTPLSAYTVTVGGTKVGSTGDGTKGNPSWFGNVSLVYAEGGNGGTRNGTTFGVGGAGSTALCIGDTVYAGGNGANGTNALSYGSGGAGGGAGSTGAGGSTTTGAAGTGTSVDGGNGGAGVGTTLSNGNAGSAAGGGGSGAYIIKNRNQTGGTGARGQVKISW